MAPERILDMPVDPRSDIFSLGVVMYEMATGHRPFAGTSPVLKVLDAEPEPLTSCRPSRPRLLDAIVQRALAKDRNDRYQSRAEMFNALGELSTQAWRAQQKSHVTRVNDRRGNYSSLRAGGQQQHGLSLCAAK